MKGISAVIGALIVLIITIVLGGLAYTYILGTATSRIAVILEIDTSVTTCNAATNVITVGLINSGTSPIALSAITITGTNSVGSTIPQIACGLATSNITAGGRFTCTSTVAGTDGNNNLVITGSGSTATGIVYCA